MPPSDLPVRQLEKTPQDVFSISELSRAFGVTPRALRFYEDKALLHPARKGLTRVYSRRDRARLGLILRGRRLGFSLADIKEMLDLYDTGDGQVAQLRVSLEKSRAQLRKMREQARELAEIVEELDGHCRMLDGLLRDRRDDRSDA